MEDYNLGNYYLLLGDYRKAEEHYLKAVNNNFVQALNNLGITYFCLGHLDKALEYLYLASSLCDCVEVKANYAAIKEGKRYNFFIGS